MSDAEADDQQENEGFNFTADSLADACHSRGSPSSDVSNLSDSNSGMGDDSMSDLGDSPAPDSPRDRIIQQSSDSRGTDSDVAAEHENNEDSSLYSNSNRNSRDNSSSGSLAMSDADADSTAGVVSGVQKSVDNVPDTLREGKSPLSEENIALSPNAEESQHHPDSCDVDALETHDPPVIVMSSVKVDTLDTEDIQEPVFDSANPALNITQDTEKPPEFAGSLTHSLTSMPRQEAPAPTEYPDCPPPPLDERYLNSPADPSHVCDRMTNDVPSTTTFDNPDQSIPSIPQLDTEASWGEEGGPETGRIDTNRGQSEAFSPGPTSDHDECTTTYDKKGASTVEVKTHAETLQLTLDESDEEEDLRVLRKRRQQASMHAFGVESELEDKEIETGRVSECSVEGHSAPVGKAAAESEYIAQDSSFADREARVRDVQLDWGSYRSSYEQKEYDLWSKRWPEDSQPKDSKINVAFGRTSGEKDTIMAHTGGASAGLKLKRPVGTRLGYDTRKEQSDSKCVLPPRKDRRQWNTCDGRQPSARVATIVPGNRKNISKRANQTATISRTSQLERSDKNNILSQSMGVSNSKCEVKVRRPEHPRPWGSGIPRAQSTGKTPRVENRRPASAPRLHSSRSEKRTTTENFAPRQEGAVETDRIPKDDDATAGEECLSAPAKALQTRLRQQRRSLPTCNRADEATLDSSLDHKVRVLTEKVKSLTASNADITESIQQLSDVVCNEVGSMEEAVLNQVHVIKENVRDLDRKQLLTRNAVIQLQEKHSMVDTKLRSSLRQFRMEEEMRVASYVRRSLDKNKANTVAYRTAPIRANEICESGILRQKIPNYDHVKPKVDCRRHKVDITEARQTVRSCSRGVQVNDSIDEWQDQDYTGGGERSDDPESVADFSGVNSGSAVCPEDGSDDNDLSAMTTSIDGNETYDSDKAVLDSSRRSNTVFSPYVSHHVESATICSDSPSRNVCVPVPVKTSSYPRESVPNVEPSCCHKPKGAGHKEDQESRRVITTDKKSCIETHPDKPYIERHRWDLTLRDGGVSKCDDVRDVGFSDKLARRRSLFEKKQRLQLLSHSYQRQVAESPSLVSTPVPTIVQSVSDSKKLNATSDWWTDLMLRKAEAERRGFESHMRVMKS